VPSAAGPLGPGLWPQPRDTFHEHFEERKTLGTIVDILSEALVAKVRCPKAEAWVSRLSRKARTDGWGAPVVAECVNDDLVVRSLGEDGVRGNSDDVRVSLDDYAFWPPTAWPLSSRKRPK